MWLLLLEALAAGLILVFIIWWTMFSGRKGGELIQDPAPAPAPAADAADQDKVAESGKPAAQAPQDPSA